jgi:hypothetical protein
LRFNVRSVASERGQVAVTALVAKDP